MLKYLILLLFIFACTTPKAADKVCGNFIKNTNSGEEVYWHKLPVKYSIDPSVPKEYIPSIEKSMEVWNKVLGVKAFEPSTDSVLTIYFFPKWDEDRKIEQARTTVGWYNSIPEKAIIKVNAEFFKFSIKDVPEENTVDFQSLMIHELGHSLGLSHVPMETMSVMNPSLFLQLLRRKLYPIDIQSITCRYK